MLGRTNGGSTGHLTANDDNTYDIGASGATRPRTLYLGTSLALASAALINTAPSAPVACTTPTVTWSNGTIAFQIDVGPARTAISTLVVTLPAAMNGWAGCEAMNVGSAATRYVALTDSTTTAITLTNFSRTLGTAADWTAGDDVRVGGCVVG